jgi:protoporphyrinogen oxidase
VAPEPRVLIVGAGPTGIGAAWRLHELEHVNWALYEVAPHAGGLATSFIDLHGFTWDIGGHVLFSHYKYFDHVVNAALGDAWVEHVREAWVWMRDRWIPYPFQNNIWRLPEADLEACVDGLLQLHSQKKAGHPASFREWLLAAFGQGLCDTFMFPYNKKVWAYDPAKLDVGWMGERVATVDLSRILRNLIHRRDDVAWGPNSTFRFPLRGGTGAIWHAAASRLPAQRLNFNRRVIRIDATERAIVFDDDRREPYDFLISTMPLDHLLRGLAGFRDLARHADQFVHSSTHVVGVGLAGQPPESLKTKCWMYFPEPQVPFYRVTVFSNYSPNNVPRPGQEWSLMAEVSESADKPVDPASIESSVVEGLRACRLIPDGTRIIARWHRRIEHGYPTPWLGRDAVLVPVDEQLRRMNIFSRGRFGAWKYEVSNQDHSLMQGVEAVNNILLGNPERTYYGNMTD